MKHLATALALLAAPAFADEDRFVASNTYATFYHELGHALVDILELPIFGQEEDAADVLSAFLISEVWEEEYAVEVAYDAAFGFLGEAEQLSPDEVAFWGVHGPDLQRYYNLVCIFYGASPEDREDIAEELGLPEERQETCEDEYFQAAKSWGAVLDRLAESTDTGALILRGDDPEQEAILAEEIAWFNEEFSFPQDIPVNLENCDEANAFYDLDTQEITMCSEYPDYYRELYRQGLE